MAATKRKKKRRRSPEIVALRRRVLDLEGDIEMHFNWIVDVRQHARELENVLQKLIDTLIERPRKKKRNAQ